MSDMLRLSSRWQRSSQVTFTVLRLPSRRQAEASDIYFPAPASILTKCVVLFEFDLLPHLPCGATMDPKLLDCLLINVGHVACVARNRLPGRFHQSSAVRRMMRWSLAAYKIDGSRLSKSFHTQRAPERQYTRRNSASGCARPASTRVT